MQRGPVPGRSKSSSVSQIFVVETEPRCSIVPLGRGYFSDDSRHFVPGYYQLSLRDKDSACPGRMVSLRDRRPGQQVSAFLFLRGPRATRFFSSSPALDFYDCSTATMQTSSSNSDFLEKSQASANNALNSCSAGRSAWVLRLEITDFSPNCSPSGDSTS
jgi:hypothetical protein